MNIIAPRAKNANVQEGHNPGDIRKAFIDTLFPKGFDDGSCQVHHQREGCDGQNRRQYADCDHQGAHDADPIFNHQRTTDEGIHRIGKHAAYDGYEFVDGKLCGAESDAIDGGASHSLEGGNPQEYHKHHADAPSGDLFYKGGHFANLHPLADIADHDHDSADEYHG